VYGGGDVCGGDVCGGGNVCVCVEEGMCVCVEEGCVWREGCGRRLCGEQGFLWRKGVVCGGDGDVCGEEVCGDVHVDVCGGDGMCVEEMCVEMQMEGWVRTYVS